MKPGGRKNAHAARAPAASKRWETAMHSEMEKTAHALSLRTVEDDMARRKDIADRKISNTKTSISFGHEKVQHLVFCSSSSPSFAALRHQSIFFLRFPPDPLH